MTQLEASEHLEENIDTHYSDMPPKDNVHPSSDAASSALRVCEAKCQNTVFYHLASWERPQMVANSLAVNMEKSYKFTPY